ncbi:MAG: DUF3078 domain-containing protein [Candidatus Cryptobacteroides sp.]
MRTSGIIIRLTTLLLAAGTSGISAAAQELTDAQKAAAQAAQAITEAPKVEQKAAKPKYWTESLKTNLNIGQTSLTNWAAGGDNTFSLQGFIDANANYKKDEMFWNNRLQLDFGILYASSKPLLQKSTDRMYLESKWGYKTASMKNFYSSANYDFKSQFAKGWDYKTPSVPDSYKDAEGNLPELDDIPRRDQKQLWKDARVLKSNFLAPAYTNLALGIDYTPTKWLAVNFAPVTGGFVIVTDQSLRTKYGMEYKKGVTDADLDALKASEEYKAMSASQQLNSVGGLYRNARFEFGAQLKIDIKVNVNDNFSYSTQIVLFEDYLKSHKKNPCPRINWDNRVDWKIAKYFSFTLTTNLIYDDMVMFSTEAYEKRCSKNSRYNSKWGSEGWANQGGGPLVQFKESIAFGFTYTIASKKN